MARQRVAIVCGAIRTEIELAIVLGQLIDHRRAGKLDRIIVSTWFGEFEGKEELEKLIQENAIEVVSGVGFKDGGWHNMWRQKKALYQALQFIEKDALVLRLRTDKSAQLIDIFVERMNAPLVKSASGIFENKIIVTQISATIPFMIDDFVFMGGWHDMYKLTLLDETYTQLCSAMDVPAEVRWFFAPFARTYPEFEEYYNKFNGVLFASHFGKFLREGNEESLPNSIKNFLVHYWQVVTDAYEPIRVHPKPEGINWRTVFFSKGTLGVRDMAHARIISHRGVLEAALESYPDKPIKCPDISSSEFEADILSILPKDQHSAILRGDLPVISSVGTLQQAEQTGSKDALLEAALSIKGIEVNGAELSSLVSVLRQHASRLPFGAALFEVGEAYLAGQHGLPVDKEKALYWWKQSVSMRDPRALNRIISTFPSINEAIQHEDIQRYIANVGSRDQETFCRAADAYFAQPFKSRWLSEKFFLPRLMQLDAQGKVEAQDVLRRWREHNAAA